MQYQSAINTFGEYLEINAEDRRFLITVVDPELTEDDLLVRVEISFLEDLQEMQPGATGGRFQSLKSGRLSAALLVDWGVVDSTNGRQFVEFCKSWDRDTYYLKGSKHPRAIINGGHVTGRIAEFTGPTGVQCAGLTQVNIRDGRLVVGGSGATEESRAFIQQLLGGTPTAKNKVADLF